MVKSRLVNIMLADGNWLEIFNLPVRQREAIANFEKP